MANTWFDFKQFRIEQENAAFKVGTDSCLMASWIDVSSCEHILDIGTGSGIIALMLAQRSSATIDGIDIDEKSSNQAQFNFQQSPWSNRLTSIHQSLDEFAKTTSKSYDLLVSNPPYFVGSTKNIDQRIKNARHEGNLQLSSLVFHAKNLLTENGKLALVLPLDRYHDLKKEASNNNFHSLKELFIRPNKEKAVNRFIAVLSKTTSTSTQSSELVLYQAFNKYSPEAIELLKPYYLNL